MPNLFYQLDSAIQKGFREGIDKHSLKHNGGCMDKVCSRSERDSLQQVAHEFKDFMVESIPGVKFIKDVTADHWQRFLDEKAKTCSTATLLNYVSRINKLQVLAEVKFRVEVSWSGNILAPKSQKTPDGRKLRTAAMEKDDMNRILEYCRRSGSESCKGVELSYRFDLRVSETANSRVRDVDFVKMKLHVKGKGGRHRWLPITPQDVKFLQSLIKGKGPDDNLIGVKSKSINQQLGRILTAMGLKDKYKETGIHSIRKLRAQELWDRERLGGSDKSEAAGYVSAYLGHGRKRRDVISVYVQNPW